MTRRSATAVLAIALALAPVAAFAQSPAPNPQSKPIPRTPDGKPDFTGFFNIQYTPNMAMGKEDSIPYTAAGKAAYLNHDAKDDPTSNCWFPGVPRIMQSPYPAQFVQTPSHLAILFEYMHTFRSIPLNGRPHPANMEPAFMGDSTGHWEGDTLVVDTVGLNDKTWIDRDGHPHSDKMHVIERIHRVGADTLKVGITVDDPVAYTKPLVGEMTFQARPDWHIEEHICEDNVNDADLEK